MLPNGVPLGLSGLSPGTCLSHRLRPSAGGFLLIAAQQDALEEVNSIFGIHIAGMRFPEWHKTSRYCSADFSFERLAYMIYVYNTLGGSYIPADSCKVGSILGHGTATELVKMKREIAYIGVPEKSLLLFATLV